MIEIVSFKIRPDNVKISRVRSALLRSTGLWFVLNLTLFSGSVFFHKQIKQQTSSSHLFHKDALINLPSHFLVEPGMDSLM